MATDIKFLTDRETKVDLLNNEAIAKTIASLIQESSDHPLSIGVHGDWGAGKSSVLEMVKAHLDKDDDYLCLKFNGWQFQGFEDAKIAVIENIVTQLVDSRSLWQNAKEEAVSIFKRIDWLKLAKRTGGLALTAFTGIPSPEQISSVLSNLKGLIGNPQDLVTKENAEASAEFLSGLLKDKPTKNIPNEIQEFRKEFNELVKKSGIKKLVVLIDDLDRCLPETAIETLEAIRLFMFMEKTAFIVGADEAMIEYSVKKHFPDLPEGSNSNTYARNYLEKLIQVPMRLSSLGEVETGIYIKLSILGVFCGEDSENFNRILEVGRKAFQKPWENDGLDTEEIKTILGDDYSNVSPALILAEQITPILSSGTKGNPRQIKRFLNALTIRNEISKARGFSSFIQIDVLAKLMLAEMFIPETFDHIARSISSSEDGQCLELIELENEATGSTRTNGDQVGEKKKYDEDIVTEWRGNTTVMNWLKISPQFDKTSLKPYLFVIKDKKNYIGAQAPLSRELRTLLEKLNGGEISSRSVAADIKGLVPAQVEQIFDELKRKLLAGPLESHPIAFYGMVELVKNQPSMQNRFIGMLEEMPPSKLGTWVAVGFDAVLIDPGAKQRFTALKIKWSQQGSKALRLFASKNSKEKQ